MTGGAAAGGGPRIEFVRLTEVPVTAHPRIGRIVARLGFAPDGEVLQDGVPFLRYRLTRRTWTARAAP